MTRVMTKPYLLWVYCILGVSIFYGSATWAQLTPGNGIVADVAAGTGGRGALFEVDPATGNRTLISDFGDASQGPLGSSPFDPAITSSGSVLVTDLSVGTSGKGAIFAVDPATGNRTLISDFGDASQGPLGQNPFGVAITSSGRALVIDPSVGGGLGALFEVDLATGNRTIISNFSDASQGPLGNEPIGLAITSAGTVLVSDFIAGTANGGALFAVDPATGNRTLISDFGDASQGPLGKDPRGITIFGVGVTITANAGSGKTVDEGILVNLDGTGSTPDPNTLNFAWSQVGGPTVVLSGANTAMPSFTSPYVSSNQTLTFELIVDDGTNFSDPDTVDIMVVSVNTPPVADAGDDSTIKEGGAATFDGSNSFDHETDQISQYTWTQVAGPAVGLDLTNPVMPTFVPNAVVGTDYVFKLEVSDGKESSVPSAGTDSSFDDTVKVTVVLNSAPTANAGLDVVVDEASNVPLAGSGSDPDGDAVTYLWSQVSGLSVTINNSTSATANFTAPYVSPGGADLVFELRVDDNDLINPLFGTDRVTIHLSNINDPPTCALAQPSQDSLWPPNHTMQQITIEGVMDVDSVYNTITLDITGVTQDEPVNGLGDGDSSPDAVIQDDAVADTVLIRAERSGIGNGRVYQINFTASDGAESCQGAVQVAVPHSRKSGSVDDGPVNDSTQP